MRVSSVRDHKSPSPSVLSVLLTCRLIAAREEFSQNWLVAFGLRAKPALCLCGESSPLCAWHEGETDSPQEETHEERFELPAGQFVTLETEQYDIGFEAQVLDPGGGEVVRGALEYDPRRPPARHRGVACKRRCP